jgi:hypothetical protein
MFCPFEGLSKEEIDAAIARSGTAEDEHKVLPSSAVPPQGQLYAAVQPTPPPPSKPSTFYFLFGLPTYEFQYLSGREPRIMQLPPLL